MRRSRTAAAESKRRIVEETARLVRAHGPEGVSVADLMAAAGMTHGGFYAHFPSKDALVAAAVDRAFMEIIGRFDQADAGAADRPDPVVRYLDGYLSMAHVREPATGCPIPVLGSDAARGSPMAKAAMADGVAHTVAAITARLARVGIDRAAAIRLFTAAVGAVVLARAAADDTLAAEILDAVRGSEPLRVLLDGAEAAEGCPAEETPQAQP